VSLIPVLVVCAIPFALYYAGYRHGVRCEQRRRGVVKMATPTPGRPA
jgi:hypothetical protein